MFCLDLPFFPTYLKLKFTLKSVQPCFLCMHLAWNMIFWGNSTSHPQYQLVDAYYHNLYLSKSKCVNRIDVLMGVLPDYIIYNLKTVNIVIRKTKQSTAYFILCDVCRSRGSCSKEKSVREKGKSTARWWKKSAAACLTKKRFCLWVGSQIRSMMI